MTISDLADYSGVTEKRIRENLGGIQGCIKSQDDIVFAEGTRFPYNMGNYKLNNRGKRYCALLSATCRCQYIDHKMLKIPKTSFIAMLEELKNAGYLQDNGTGNLFGANRYDTTFQYEQIRQKRVETRIRLISEAIAKAAHLVPIVV